MGPHPEVPVDVQKYIGSYLITQQPRGKRKTCARQGGKDSRGAGYSGGAAAPICNSCCAPQVNKVRGYNGLNNYAWTGVPLISVANARQKTHLGNQKSRPTQRVKQPERLVDYSRHTESPDGSFTGGSSIGLEDILSISQLAIHAQGAPLIISPSEKEKGSEKDPRKDGEGYLLKGRNMFVSSNSTMYVMMNSPPEASHLPYVLDEEAVSGESDFKSDTSLSRQTSPSQSDCVSTTSEDSVTSENGLPRIIKPRKRRKKDRRVSDSGSDRFEDVGVGTAIVTLKPYQPLCYRYSEPAARQYLSADDLDNSSATVESPDEQQMSPEPSHYPCPSSLLCRCSYCVPSSVFLTPPQSPIESLVNCNKREHPFYEISSDVTNSRGHRDLEIKLFSQISNSSEDDDVNFEAGSSPYSYLQDNAPSTLLGAPPPPERPWVEQAKKSLVSSSCTFTVMCYNILCDKYATRQMYGYCPSWALEWLYRRKRIMDEIIHYRADILSLQEVETEQFYNFFLPELRKLGYDGIFSPKSRAKTMSENERRHVDGCAIFFKTSKFVLLKEHLVEFNQLAMANAEGSDDMLNRVMTKDNIGLAALLQTTPGAYDSDAKDCNRPSQSLLVCTAHIHWDPEYSDVKLIQTMMLMHELNSIVDSTLKRCSSMNNQRHDPNDIPLLLCGDFNSLPDSGVIEYLSSGRISTNHIDFKEFVYKDCLRKLCNSPRLNEFTHPFKIARAYEKDIMPFTNYSYEFKGTIDYVFYSTLNMKVIGVLGPLDPKWLQENHVHGCPHPFIPSDHFPILVELQLFPTPSTYSAVSNGVKQHR